MFTAARACKRQSRQCANHIGCLQFAVWKYPVNLKIDQRMVDANHYISLTSAPLWTTPWTVSQRELHESEGSPNLSSPRSPARAVIRPPSSHSSFQTPRSIAAVLKRANASSSLFPRTKQVTLTTPSRDNSRARMKTPRNPVPPVKKIFSPSTGTPAGAL